MLMAELKVAMKRAEQGKHVCGPSDVGSVEWMQSSTDVLEMRLATRRGDDNKHLHIRLYFSEPDTHPELLLALALRWKQPYPAGRVEQDQHILEAQDLYNDWVSAGSP